MEPTLMQSRESLAATIRRGVRVLTIISGAAFLVTAVVLDFPQWMLGVSLVAIFLDWVFRERAIANLQTARGSEQLDRLRKRIYIERSSIWLGFSTALLALLQIRRGQSIPFSIGVAVAFVSIGLLAHFRVRPPIARAWDRLRDLG